MPLYIKPLVVDYTREESFKQILPGSPTLSSPIFAWEGLGAFHYYLKHPPHKTPEHRHTHHIVHIHLNGSQGIETQMDNCYHLEHIQSGNMFITPANVNHTSALLDDDSEFIVLDLDPAFLSNCTHESISLDSIELLPHFVQADPLIYQIGLSLKAELIAGDSSERFYAESLLTALSAHILRNYASYPLRLPECESGLPKYKLKQVFTYIHEHLDQNIQLADLGNVVGMSQHYFCRCFKQSMGISPYQYVIQQRVNRAGKLLKQRNLTISEIALQCGFANQDHFTKTFRQIVGVTPKAYQNQ